MLQFYPSFGYCKNAKLLELGCVDIMRERERERERETERQRDRERDRERESYLLSLDTQAPVLYGA